MDSYMMPTGLPVNGFLPLAGLPLFDWRPPALPSRPSPRVSRALEIARTTGLPLGVVIVHMQAAGLGLEG